ncbi:RelA/SpoT family protein [Spirochaeta africana]|uniref:(P)ppGpp synthetase, RelA/SpoT family n=1 Tax=Spirochaeta africana (strain ATCC 700263 / DSM 8902 / Z-7692) TaxID=889378 RepID=H9UK39_SPIAZ|nr:bifunctional (p)ppGpp synthetase/guanosine-3',5'-bis(diphosphate) 3'-pyrophosphohydrolase [Spirochaeta africana]AFG37882.1 (p)ppGpp synthetase, RelA/SpoT family [Spirochaeta africana DSM 8902]
MVHDLDSFAAILTPYSPAEQEQIMRAARTSKKLHQGQMRESGDEYYTHPLQVAEILVGMRLDPPGIIGALLHDVLEDTTMSRQELREQFGKDVEALVNGVTKISLVKAKNKSVQEAETIRKMLFAMVKDIRVILIKLADKLHNMRTLGFKNQQRRIAIAQECLDIYAPLAGRLGISWLKDELEDLSLKHINPQAYAQIKAFVAQKKQERGDYLQRVQKAIYDEADKEGFSISVETRAKHFYSIYNKMRRRSKDLDEIYDTLGIRILCNSPTDCYALLGLVHKLWMPIEGRFKDYIAMPKSNRYQSLHTTVMCFGGRLIEIQIRTFAMHNTAEFGVAAHWLYKDNTPGSPQSHDLAIINRVRSLNGLKITSNEFLDEIKREILKGSIYVFTPKGDAVQLPKGATAIDFAYHIHTEIGDHISGAKADGAIIPLREPLRNTQVIEIMTSPQAHPHVHWLRYVRTTRARSKIRHWLNKHDENLILDKSIVARKRGSAQEQPLPPKSPAKTKSSEVDTSTIMDTKKVGVRIGDERNLMIRFANCCHPKTGDPIVGYVSRGRGIIVHHRDCKNLKHISEIENRTIEVEWETVSPKVTRRLQVTARKTPNLFSEIEGAIRKVHGHLIEGRVDESDNGNLDARFTLEIERAADMESIIRAIRSLPSILTIAKLDPHPNPSVF